MRQLISAATPVNRAGTGAVKEPGANSGLGRVGEIGIERAGHPDQLRMQGPAVGIDGSRRRTGRPLEYFRSVR